MRIKTIFFLFLLCFAANTVLAQHQNPPFYINVLVDADQVIFVENKMVKFEKIPEAVKNIVYNQPASKFEGVVYRIYGEESLKLGVIMNIGNELMNGFRPLRTERYLLNLEEKEIDGTNYIQKLEKLDLKAIEH